MNCCGEKILVKGCRGKQGPRGPRGLRGPTGSSGISPSALDIVVYSQNYGSFDGEDYLPRILINNPGPIAYIAYDPSKNPGTTIVGFDVVYQATTGEFFDFELRRSNGDIISSSNVESLSNDINVFSTSSINTGNVPNSIDYLIVFIDNPENPFEVYSTNIYVG